MYRHLLIALMIIGASLPLISCQNAETGISVPPKASNEDWRDDTIPEIAGHEPVDFSGLEEAVSMQNEEAEEYFEPTDTLDGWLMLGVGEKIVRSRLGVPEDKGENVYWGATGTYNQEWKYPGYGITLGMESDSESGEQHVASITIFSPCEMRTAKDIGIGSDSEEIREKYVEGIDKAFTNEEMIVVGSIYGGVIFYLEAGKVTMIFVGALAE